MEHIRTRIVGNSYLMDRYMRLQEGFLQAALAHWAPLDSTQPEVTLVSGWVRYAVTCQWPFEAKLSEGCPCKKLREVIALRYKVDYDHVRLVVDDILENDEDASISSSSKLRADIVEEASINLSRCPRADTPEEDEDASGRVRYAVTIQQPVQKELPPGCLCEHLREVIALEHQVDYDHVRLVVDDIPLHDEYASISSSRKVRADIQIHGGDEDDWTQEEEYFRELPDEMKDACLLILSNFRAFPHCRTSDMDCSSWKGELLEMLLETVRDCTYNRASVETTNVMATLQGMLK
eukprot:6044904-Amphidinium_carterae.3